MSFYTVIYSSLGMSAFWEIHEKVAEIMKIVGSFSGGRREWTWALFRVDFGIILGPVGAQNRKKGDPETLTKNDRKKVLQDIPSNSDTGGGRPLKLVNSILKTIHIDPLSLHCVPQGHGE